MNYSPYIVTQFSHILCTDVMQLLDLSLWIQSPGSDTISGNITLYTLINTRAHFRSTKHSSTLVAVLSYMILVYIFPLHFCMINFTIKTCYLPLRLPIGLLPSGFRIKTLHSFLLSAMRATYSAYLFLQPVFDKVATLCRCLLCVRPIHFKTRT